MDQVKTYETHVVTTKNMVSNVALEEPFYDHMDVREMMRRMQRQMDEMQMKYEKEIKVLHAKIKIIRQKRNDKSLIPSILTL